MRGLFEAFSLKCAQLKHAVTGGNDLLVRMLDRELEPIIADILAHRAQTSEDAHMQLQFLNGLIRDEAEDKSSVMRRSAAMSMLIDRYFQSGDELVDAVKFPFRKVEKDPVQVMPDQSLLNEAVLDILPDRIGVITRDYRYLYSNQANADFLGRTPLSMVGCHVSEFIGEESFTKLAKPAFDKCFAGAVIDYMHHGRRDNADFTTRCRLTPLRASNKEIVGAAMVLQGVDDLVELEFN